MARNERSKKTGEHDDEGTQMQGGALRRDFMAMMAASFAAGCGDESGNMAGSDGGSTSGGSGGSTSSGGGTGDSTSGRGPTSGSGTSGDDGSTSGDQSEGTDGSTGEPVDPPPDPPPLPGEPFTMGVASGDPTPSGMMLWTRLGPEPLADGGMPEVDVPVIWEIANDANFDDIVRHGWEWATPDMAHNVRVDVDGLEADRWYFYRFRVGDDWTSRTGRTRTVPAPGSPVAHLRIGVASCQDWKDGYYTAHSHMAVEGLDLLLWLGDYIYESGNSGDVRDHNTGEAIELPGYRDRYAQYRTDPGLQELHAACPWIITWDDHEVLNDHAGDYIPPEDDDGSFDMVERRAAAYRAFWEHQPVRVDPPVGASLMLHRSIRYGDLIEFFVCDTRQHRTPPVCGGEQGFACPDLGGEDDWVLGQDQEIWLYTAMIASDARWRTIAQSVVFNDLTVDEIIVNFDQWDGYPDARQRIHDFVVDQDIDGFVVFSGDIHMPILGNLTEDADDSSSDVIGVEIVTNAMSSGIKPEAEALATLLPALNRYRYAEGSHAGYTVVDIYPEHMDITFRNVDTITEPVSGVFTDAQFRIFPDGNINNA